MGSHSSTGENERQQAMREQASMGKAELNAGLTGYGFMTGELDGQQGHRSCSQASPRGLNAGGL